MTNDELLKLIEQDDLGLLAVQPKRSLKSTEEELILEKFQNIIKFIGENGGVPIEQGQGIDERVFYVSLKAIRQNRRFRSILLPFDELGLLQELDNDVDRDNLISPQSEPTTLEDIFNDPLFKELEEIDDDIYNLKHVPHSKDIESPDYVAQRKPCKDFKEFEEIFKECQWEIKSEKRKLLPFANEQQIEAGKFYILRGILLFVSQVGERVEKNGKRNARLRCIFENGTESDMLLRSLSCELYKDGRRVTEIEANTLKKLQVNDDDVSHGHIYVLRSLSQNPNIIEIPNLYKIGMARQSIESRIQNAEQEPTYLMAPVVLIASYECFNVKLNQMESLLHRFLDSVRVRVQVTDSAGDYHTPKEWFSVPLNIVEQTVGLLISGEIINFKYDNATEQIVKN